MQEALVLTEETPLPGPLPEGEREFCVESLSWTVRLSDDAPHKRWIVLIAAVIAGVSGVVLLQQVLLGFIGFAMILASTAEYWLGARYSVDEKGASRRCGLSLTSIDWEDVKRVVVQGADVLVSPLQDAGRMDAFRGVVLRTKPDNREEVIAAVKSRVGEGVAVLG